MKKRILGFVLACVMAVSMTACVGKEKIGGNRVTISASDLKTTMKNELNKIDSVDIKLNGDLCIKAKLNTNKAGVELENSGKYTFDFDSEALINVKEPGAYINYKLGISTDNEKLFNDFKLSDDGYEGEFYVNVEDDNVEWYYDIGKGWYKNSTTTDEIMNEVMPEISEYIDFNQLFIFTADDEDVDLEFLPVLSNKTVEACGKECYELVVMHGKEALGGNLAMKQYYDNVQEFGYKICLYVDTETKLPLKMIYDIDMVMTDNVNGVEQILDCNDFTFEMTMVYNEVEPIVVPDDVKNASYDYNAAK